MNDRRRTTAAQRFPTLIACSLLLLTSSACVTWTPRSRQISSSAAVIPNVPMQTWGIEACGAGAISTVLQRYGDPMTMKEWDATLPRTRGGVMTVDLLIAARSRGYEARLVTGEPEMIEAELREGRPVILMLQVIDSPGSGYDFFHYVVADGIDDERSLIRTQFGDGKGRWVSFKTLDKPWEGGGRAAIFIRPRTVDEEIRAAVAMESDGKLDQASAAYLRLIEKSPASALLWTNLGNVERQRGRHEAAEAAYRKALELDPGFRDALNNLAWHLYENKRFEEAEVLARRAVELNEADRWMVRDTLARILAARGACAEASEAFRLALADMPGEQQTARADLERAMSEAASSCRLQ